MQGEIRKTEEEIWGLVNKLHELRKKNPGSEVPNYKFRTLTGETSLRDLFGQKTKLFAIHNMGQGCRYCTLWADGINGFLPHFESEFAIALLSKDSPELQRRFANSRGWRFQLASHGGGEYLSEQSIESGKGNLPGVVCYELEEGKIFRKNASIFGPGDLFCSIWHFLSLGGITEKEWTPQYDYWKRPETLDDGGKNVL